MSLDYIRDTYRVPAEEQRRVTCSGKPGVIMKAMGAYIGVLIDGDDKIRPYHPTWEVVYGDLAPEPEIKLREWRCLPPWNDEWETDAWFTVHAATRAQARYRAYRYLSDDCECMMEPKSMCYITVRVRH